MAAEPRPRADRWILGSAALLTGLGIVTVYSTSSPLSFGREGADAFYYLKRSLGYAAVGAAACGVAARVGPERWRSLAYPALVLAILLLFLPWVPGLAHSAKGAQRWVRIGGFGFQPSEVAKFALVLFLAHNLTRRADRITTFSRGFLPTVVLPGIPIGLVLLEPDLGTAILLSAVVACMAFAGGVRLRHLSAAAAPALVGVAGLLWFVDFRRERLLAFLDPWANAQGAAFQLVQSLLAFGTGGVWGVGLGAGRQKLHYLPEAHTDFILSVWAEELGLLGVLAVLVLTAVLVGRGFAIALRQSDPFRRLLATGISCWLGLQAGINALVVMGLLPTKGMSYPFLSYGGTGLVISLAAAGVLAGLGREEPACAS